MEPRKLLVFSPHCDDAELGAGGYIARFINKGGVVRVCVAAASMIEFLHTGAVGAATRIDEFKNSMRVLGVHQYNVFSHSHDGMLEQLPSKDIVQWIDNQQNTFQPHEILIPLPSSHQDHGTMYRMCIAGTRPSPYKHRPSLVAAYEYPSICWGEGAGVDRSRGGMYVNISEYMKTKIEALNCYASQMRGDDALISTEAVQSLARLRGIEAGFKHAELFHVLREIHC